jgi:hypothetical protein
MAGPGELAAESWDGAGVVLETRLDDLPPELIARIRAEAVSDPGMAGVATLRDLLRIETREARFKRVLRVWEGKVVAALRARDLAAAEAWFKSVTVHPTFPGEFVAHVQRAFQALARPAVIDDLLEWLVAEEKIEEGAALLAAWGEPVVNRIVELMAMEEPPISRRHQVDLLAVVGRSDTRLLIMHLNDRRWFIARNMAIAIGRTGRLQGVGPLRSLLSHPDPRVRVEALRGVAALDSDLGLPDIVKGFRDDNPRVRQAAVTLLRASPNPQVIPVLAGLVERGGLSGADSERLVEVIAERKGPEAEAALRRFAERRFARGGARAAREAARRALKGRTS